MGHKLAVQFDLVMGVDGFLAIEWQAIGIFGDGDLGQKRIRRNAAFDDVCRSRRLDDAVLVLEGVFRAARDDDTELRCDDVQSFGNVFSDQDFLLSASEKYEVDYPMNRRDDVELRKSASPVSSMAAPQTRKPMSQ